MKKIRVAILGATGYGGGELLRLLLQDPGVDVRFATSRSKIGVPVAQVHPNLASFNLPFSDPSVDELVEQCDVVFGALPHGASAETLAPLVDRGVTVIDLSGDFRLKDPAQYKKWYKHDHPRPDLLERAVYGCPELNRDALKGAKLVASPGCFATSINLALLPAARAGWLRGNVGVVAMTGSSGSGAEPQAGTHHPTRAGTLRPYKVLSHQHVPECVQTVKDAGGMKVDIAFTPVSAPLVRGILAVVQADIAVAHSTAEAENLYRDFYGPHPFVRVLTAREPECASVAGTNFAEVRPRVGADGRLHVLTSIDNLVKGGAGQAVQSFNIMFRTENSSPLNAPGLWP